MKQERKKRVREATNLTLLPEVKEMLDALAVRMRLRSKSEVIEHLVRATLEEEMRGKGE